MAKSPVVIPYDSTGTELGTSSNPIRTNPTGTTAQPVTDNGGSLTVDGSVSVSNFPATQNVADGGGSLTVDGSVSVSNFPSVQPVNDNGGSLTVDGTVTSNQGSPNTTANSWPIKVTDGTNVASVTAAGALKVDTGAAVPLAGLVEEFLKNGAVDNMNVNASAGAPQIFKYEPDAVHDVELQSIVVVGEVGTVDFGNKFLVGTSALTNGILVEIKAGDVVYTLANMKTSRELALFSNNGFSVFVSGQDIAIATRVFPTGLTLKKAGTYATNDYIRFTIRDNLSGLTSFQARIKGVKK